MTNSSQVNVQLPINAGTTLSAKDHDEKIQGAASAVSLSEIEELFQTLDDQMNANDKNEKSDKSGEKKLMALITELVSEIGSGKAASGNAMSELKGLVKEFYGGDNSALAKVLGIVMPAVMGYAQKNPNDMMSVIKAFAPLMREAGENVIKQVSTADKSFDRFRAGYLADTDPNKSTKLSGLIGKLFNGKTSASFDQTQDILNADYIKGLKIDLGRGGSVISTLFALLASIAVKDPKEAVSLAKAIAANGGIEKLVSLRGADFNDYIKALNVVKSRLGDGSLGAGAAAKHVAKVVNLPNPPAPNPNPNPKPTPPPPPPPPPPVYAPSGNSQQNEKRNEEENISKILAEAMEAAQMLQSLITKSQSKQDQWSLAMSSAKNQAAAANLKAMNAKIDKEIAAEAAAKPKHHWWDDLIKALVAIVAVVVAAVTAGVGAAIAAILIGVFMASPLMGDTVAAIAKSVAKDVYNHYYKQYKSEGKSESEAKELATQKSQAVGNLVGQIVCIVAVTVLSLGVGGVEAVGEDAADEGIEMTDFAASSAADEAGDAGETADAADAGKAATKSSKFTRNASLARKVAAFQGFSAIGSTNIWMTAMQTNPEWCKKHPKLMLILDVIAEVITMIVSVMAGGAAMKQASAGATLAEQIPATFAKYGKYLLGLNALMGGASGGYGSYSSVKQAQFLEKASSLAKDIGQLDAEFTQAEGTVKLLSTTQKSNLKQTQGIIQSEGALMDALEDVAGADTDTVNKALMSAN